MIGSTCSRSVRSRSTSSTSIPGSWRSRSSSARSSSPPRARPARRRHHRSPLPPGRAAAFVAGVELGCRAARLLGGARPVRRHDLLQHQHRLRHRCRPRPATSSTVSCGGPTSTAPSPSLRPATSPTWPSRRRAWGWRPGGRPGWIAKLNLLGSVAFGLSARRLHAAHHRRGRQHPPRQPRHLPRRRLLLRRRRPCSSPSSAPPRKVPKRSPARLGAFRRKA